MSAARILPREEWHRIPTDAAAFAGAMNPEDVAVVVVEDGGEIVARMTVYRAPHLESYWMAPEKYGNAGVTNALLEAASGQAAAWAKNWMLVHADPGPLCGTLLRLGGQWLPVETFMVPVRRKEAACHPMLNRPAQKFCQPDRITGASLESSSEPLLEEEDSTCPLL